MEPARETATRRARLRAQAGTLWLTGASLIAGVGTYLFQVIATRGLGEEAFAPIGVLWTIWYLLSTAPLFSIETYLVRAVHQEGGRFPPRLLAPVCGTILGLAVLTGVGAWWARTALFGGLDDLAAATAVLALSCGAYAVARGVLAGQRRYAAYGTTSVVESGARLLLVAPAIAVAGTRGVAWILPIGAALAGLFLLVPPRDPLPAATTADVARPTASFGAFFALTFTTNGAAQALLAAGPLVLVALGAGPATVSVFFVTTTAARIPLMVAYGGLLSRLLPPLIDITRTGPQQRIRRVVDAALAVTLGLGALAAVVGALIGPPLVGLFFGSDFRPGVVLAGGAGAGVTLACGALFLNQMLIASGRERQTLLPWLSALATAGVVVATGTSLEPTERVIAGFLAGEVLAVVLLWATQRRAVQA